MNNIVITGGMEEPWEIENTDISVPQDIILKNLATAKLAFLGSQAAVQVNAQKDVLQGIVDGTTLLSDRLDELRVPLPWTSKILKLDINDQVGLVPSSSGFDGVRLLEADNLIKKAGLESFGGEYFQFFNSKSNTFGYGLHANVVDISQYERDDYGNLYLNNQRLSHDRVIKDGGGYWWHYRVQTSPGIFYAQELYIGDSVKSFGIPSTENQIITKEAAFLQINNSINYTDNILLKKNLMYGIITSAEDKKILEDSAASEEKKIEIQKKYQQNIYSDVNVNFDTVKLNIPTETNGDQYFFFPPKSLFDKEVATIKAGTLYTLSSDTSVPKKYYYSTVSNKKLEVDFATQMKPFILKPSAEEIQNWRSQIAEKQIQLTQRSSELQNYLNELIQTYNYAFDAATNIIKMLANADNEIIRNL